jgi:hypothetical protein
VSHSGQNHEPLIFVVRLWQEVDADGYSHWRGRVEQVASQEVAYVEDLAGVAGFLERWTGAQAAAQNVTTG